MVILLNIVKSNLNYNYSLAFDFEPNEIPDPTVKKWNLVLNQSEERNGYL